MRYTDFIGRLNISRILIQSIHSTVISMGMRVFLDGRDVRAMRKLIASDDKESKDFLSFIHIWFDDDGLLEMGDYRMFSTDLQTLYQTAL